MRIPPMLALMSAVAAGGGGGSARAAAPDYARLDNWMCRPGSEAACTGGLDAMAVAADGSRRLQTYAPWVAAPLDCFYVYPTASEESTQYSDLTLTPDIAEAARTQAGRLASRCRLFVPIYRQLTAAGLSAVLAAHGTPDWDKPYADVLAAWRWYLAHDNGGRGVVLVGHSQGTILLQRLLAEQIDGQAAQRLLVAGFLAGDPALPVPLHATSGGVFKHIPLCTYATQVGCVYVWSSYLADDSSRKRLFGRNQAGALVAGCANPAAPGGGAGGLKAFFAKSRLAPASDPPWVDAEGQLTAQCAADAQGNVLRVVILPTKFAGWLRASLRDSTGDDPDGWGLHAVDLDITQGNVLDRVTQEINSWLRGHPAPQ